MDGSGSDTRAWRLAAGAGAGLLGVVALVAWRSDHVAGGWGWALRIAALVAVAGMLTAIVLAARLALDPPRRREVVVRVPSSGAPQTQVRDVRGAGQLLRTVLLLAVLSAAPALAVLVLAPGARASAEADPAARATSGPTGTRSPASPPAPSATPNATATPSASPPPPPATPPGTSVQAAPAPALPAQAAPSCEHTVVRGDTLWAIAAAQLGPGASDAQVAERWHEVYARNAAVVGADPDVLHPGQVLRACA